MLLRLKTSSAFIRMISEIRSIHPSHRRGY
jgi:hypothetical protein